MVTSFLLIATVLTAQSAGPKWTPSGRASAGAERRVLYAGPGEISGRTRPAPRTPDAWSMIAGRTPAGRVVHAQGIGFAPAGRSQAQARLMAQRAADVVAMRNLARRLHLPDDAPLPPFRCVGRATPRR